MTPVDATGTGAPASGETAGPSTSGPTRVEVTRAGASKSSAWTRTVAGVAIVLIGLLAYLGHLLNSDGGTAAWDRNPTPRSDIAVTAGQSYLISTVDGPGVLPVSAALTCAYRPGDANPTDPGPGSNLPVSALAPDTRATHAVASFVAPVSGRITVTCTGGTVGSRTVFVNNADDSGVDVAGWLLVAAVALFVVGAGVLLGGVRSLIATRG